MLHYLIMCRSLTYAQRIVQSLERVGIRAWLIRSPVSVSPSGCSYSVKITQKDLSHALMILNHFQLPYLGIYIGSPEEGYREVDL